MADGATAGQTHLTLHKSKIWLTLISTEGIILIMKQSLQLNISQQLKLTPQLQQAIKLLQLSSQDLQQEIQEQLDSNPMLETEDSNQSENHPQELLNNDQHNKDSNLNAPDDTSVETMWESVYPTSTYTSKSSEASEDHNYENYCGTEQTLQDYLLWQMNLTPFSDTDRQIALAIIEAIDDDGILKASLEDIQNCILKEEPIELDEITAVLHRIQCFDPVGVAARDLQECLLIQLKQLHSETPWLDEAIDIITNHLDLIAIKNYAQLAKVTKLNQDKLAQILKLIQTLNPRPGSIIGVSKTEYITPEVIVTKHNGRWRVDLNNEITPKLKINTDYSRLVKRADKSPDNNYLRSNLQEARWFMKSLQSRNETLLRVASCIVEFQKGFFEQGPEAMKPLVLNEVAEKLELHESTISRVTTQKFMHTPRGVFELKYFFSSHVSTASGGECSSTAIREHIKNLIKDENPRKPLSDNKITTHLKDQGINVARRTIAKYREAMNILPSNERKSLVS